MNKFPLRTYFRSWEEGGSKVDITVTQWFVKLGVSSSLILPRNVFELEEGGCCVLRQTWLLQGNQ